MANMKKTCEICGEEFDGTKNQRICHNKVHTRVCEVCGKEFIINTKNIDKTTLPRRIWSKGNKMITDNLLNQRGYDQLFSTNYGKGTSNESLMINNGWLPIYDCGQGVYSYISENRGY